MLELPDQGLLCLSKYDISDPTLVDLKVISLFFVYLYSEKQLKDTKIPLTIFH